ncbi:MAG: hypothetical protein WCL32_19545 [Planctomycetota bacterium]
MVNTDSWHFLGDGKSKAYVFSNDPNTAHLLLPGNAKPSVMTLANAVKLGGGGGEVVAQGGGNVVAQGGGNITVSRIDRNGNPMFSIQAIQNSPFAKARRY